MTNILALIVGFGSLAIYLAAFFFPEVHRKNDFIWSGVGLFYALALWVFAPRIGGWFFLGQLASVALLIWLGLQTFSLRRQVTPVMQQTPLPSPEAVKTNISEQVAKLSLQERFGGLVQTVTNILPGKKEQLSQTPTPTETTSTISTVEEDATTDAATTGESLVDAIDQDVEIKSTETSTEVSEESINMVDNAEASITTEIAPEASTQEPPTVEVVESASEPSEPTDKEERVAPAPEKPPENNPSLDDAPQA